jgi:glutamate/tyrosine decarboxylase-like PLP-dependent enzyme
MKGGLPHLRPASLLLAGRARSAIISAAMDTASLLQHASRQALAHLARLPERPVRAAATAEDLRRALGGPLAGQGVDAAAIIDALGGAGVTGAVASAGPRYYGFVTGGSLPAALAADWLVSAWDQNACVYVMSPLAAVIEEITASWLCDIVGLARTTSVGFVTGCQMANFTGLAAGRHRVLREVGWDVEAQGLFGAPAIDVLVSEEAHNTIFMALRFLGLGSGRVHRIATDGQGRMRIDALAAALKASSGPVIVCAQAGNVNTGAFDPLEAIADACVARGAWLHVDGAFGLWAAASPERATLVRGVERAQSIATDAHKWLNVPYDCGLVFCADEAAHRGAMSLVAAAYIQTTQHERDPTDFVPEASRRARAVSVYAALRSLGSGGVRDLIERNCRQARRFAEGLRAAGHEVLNEVVLNQVLVAFGDAALTERTIAAIQDEGTCWCGGTVWHGRKAMRISVSSWATTDDDVEKSLAAMLRIAKRCAAAR